MTTMNLFDMTDTWNAGATTFTAIKMNVTDTASASGSLLMDLQVGGTSQFQVSKAGKALAGDGLAYSFNAAPNTGIGRAANDLVLYSGATPTARLFSAGLAVASDNSIGFASGGVSSTTADTTLFRDAADTLALRRDTNPQALHIYNTYSGGGANYERLILSWSDTTNTFIIEPRAAGTGSNRNIRIRSRAGVLTLGDGNSDMVLTSAQCALGTRQITQLTNIVQQSGFTEMSEMTAPAAPATNNVRIYAEDNGSGKTRLMALFATGAAVQIAIEP